MTKKLTRDTANGMIGGVCAGLGDYFEVDPTIMRVLFAFLGCLGGGIILYLLCWTVIPERQDNI